MAFVFPYLGAYNASQNYVLILFLFFKFIFLVCARFNKSLKSVKLVVTFNYKKVAKFLAKPFLAKLVVKNNP